MTTGTQWITDRPPAYADLDIEGMIQIPVRPSSLSTTKGTSVSPDCWSEGMPWRHTKRRRQRHQQAQQLEIAAASTCETCRFFMKWLKPGGECRRNAPQAVALHADIDDPEHIAYWPGIDESDWCGEWEARQ